MHKRTGLWLLVLLLAGCAGSTPSSRFEPRSPAEDEAIVYIYRPARTDNFMLSPTLSINGREYFGLENGTYRVLRMHPGGYVFRIEPYSDVYAIPPPLRLQVRAGETRYLRVDTRLVFVPDGMNRRVFDLVELDARDAVEEIAKTGPP